MKLINIKILKFFWSYCGVISRKLLIKSRNQKISQKGSVKLMQRVKIVHSFFTVCIKSVPRYHFKLAFVVLQMAVKEFFETHTLLRRGSPTVQAKTREKKKAEKQLRSNMFGVEQTASVEESVKPTKKWRNRPF